MKIFKLDEIEGAIFDLIFKDKQFHGRTLFLTLKTVYRILGKGSVDFGGGEYVQADREKLEPVKRSFDDNYGWWDLEPGTYPIEYNERFESEKERLYLISPSRRIFSSGTFHPVIVVVEKKYSPKGLLIVGGSGISIKENGRISLCKVFEIQ